MVDEPMIGPNGPEAVASTRADTATMAGADTAPKRRGKAKAKRKKRPYVRRTMVDAAPNPLRSDEEAPAPARRPTASAKPTVDEAEIAYWNSVKDAKDPNDIQAYIERFPDGFFADLAERRVRQLDQWLAAGESGNPDDYKAPKKIKRAIILPTIPVPEIAAGAEVPKYQLVAPFFAENDTYYPVDTVMEYVGPPNEHMFPLNEAARTAKAEQEEYLDACWRVKCEVEGRPPVPRPKELADQIEAERKTLRAERGVVEGVNPPPSRPDLAMKRRDNPRARRVGAITAGAEYADRPNVAETPVLGRDGGRYQRRVKEGFGNTIGPDSQPA